MAGHIIKPPQCRMHSAWGGISAVLSTQHGHSALLTAPQSTAVRRGQCCGRTENRLTTDGVAKCQKASVQGSTRQVQP